MSSSFDIQTRGSRAQQNSTEASDGDVVVIVSHQRSGTHLTADFLRRNFPELALVPKPWESAEVMFYNLDRLANNRPDGWSEKALKNRSFMVLTHLLPFDPDLQDHLERLRGVRRCIMIYPFRRFSKTMASLHSYKGRTEPLSEFVTNPSPTFDPDLSVCEAWLNHASWGLERCYHINVEALLKAPEQHAQRLHDSFGWTLANVQDRLPPKKKFTGSMSELHQRLTGRKSTEVRNVRPLPDASQIADMNETGPTGEMMDQLQKKAAAFLDEVQSD